MYDVRGITLVKTDQAPDYTEVDMSSIDDTNERTIRQDDEQVIRLPSYETVAEDSEVYAQASRVLHLESNPGNARPLVQQHGGRDIWVTPPPIPLTTRKWTGSSTCPMPGHHTLFMGMRRFPLGI